MSNATPLSHMLICLATGAAIALTGCGADTTSGLGSGATAGGTTSGGLCNPAVTAKACVGLQVLACSATGTWVVHDTCGMGQKCQEAGVAGAGTACVASGSAADASGDSGSGADAGSTQDADLTDSVMDATGGGSDAALPPGGCVTYQDVQPILVQNCNGCHGHKFGDACNLAANYPLINKRIQDGTMPPDGPLSDGDKALFAAWAAGHNTCTPDKCPGADAGGTLDAGTTDTLVDTFTPPDGGTLGDSGTVSDAGGATCLGFATVKPVFANNCAGGGCHGFQNQCMGAGGKFGSTAIGASVAAGTMPPNGGMSASDQAAIAAWVQGGAICNCPTGGTDGGSTGSDTTIGDTTGADTTGSDTTGADTVGPGPDTITPPPATCGNLQCDVGETASNCAIDCGAANTCVLSNCGQQANTCMNSTNCTQAFTCQQGCTAGDTACLQACAAGKSNKVKNNLNNLNTCIANANCASGGGGGTTSHVCDAACGNPGGSIGGQTCYCDNLCGQYGDCCNATATGFGADCAGSTCGLCNAGIGPVPSTCGNGTCDAGETTATCPADCPPAPAVCGNGKCEAGETTATCPVDCPVKTCTTYADVQQILLQNCNGCHGHVFGNSCAATAGHDIAGWVASGQMPTNKTLSAADKAKIAAWAAAGNPCTTTQCP